MSNNPIAIPGNQNQTMSSTEIAELTGKQKTHVHRDIKTQILIGLYDLKDDPKMDDVKIQGITIVLDERGYWKEVHLDREHTITLITGYDVKSRHAINKRWLELEQQAAQPAPINPAQLTRMQLIQLAMQAEEELQAANETIAQLEPKAQALDLLATETEGSVNLTIAAKNLQQQPHYFNQTLSAYKWMYKRAGGGSWIAYQDKIQAGLLEHKTTTIHKQDGTEKVCTQVLVTAKGLAKLALLFNNPPKHGLKVVGGSK